MNVCVCFGATRVLHFSREVTHRGMHALNLQKQHLRVCFGPWKTTRKLHAELGGKWSHHLPYGTPQVGCVQEIRAQKTADLASRRHAWYLVGWWRSSAVLWTTLRFSELLIHTLYYCYLSFAGDMSVGAPQPIEACRRPLNPLRAPLRTPTQRRSCFPIGPPVGALGCRRSL